MVSPLEKLASLLSAIPSAEARKQWQEFQCKPGDVLIATYRKSGTTLLQQIVQSLRTSGDLSFDEISLVIPYIELAGDYGVDLNGPQPGCVRAFKSHIPKQFSPAIEGTKVINVVRNPLHVAVSLYHFFESWIFDEGTVQVDEFVDMAMANRESTKDDAICSYWRHLMSYYPHRMDENVLFLFFEDLVEHKEECIRLVAQFLGVPLSQELLDTTLQQSDFLAMSLAHAKYDDHPLKQRHNEAMGRPADAGLVHTGNEGGSMGKVRAPGKGKAKLSEVTIAWMQDEWVKTVTPGTGCTTYEEFRSQVNSELGRTFAKGSVTS